MKDMSTALFRLDLSNRCVNYRKSNNNKVRVDAGKKREKTFLSFLKKSITRFLWCIINHGTVGSYSFRRTQLKIQYLTPPLTFTKAAAGHTGVWGVPLELYLTPIGLFVLVGVKRVYRRALQGLYFT